QLSDALRTSGLVVTEPASDGQRGTVRRPLPGNDLPGRDRQRVWDLAEDAVLGDLPAGPRRPAAGAEADTAGGDGAGPAAAPAGVLVAHTGAPADREGDPGGPWAWACELGQHERETIILPSWAEPELPGPVEAVLVGVSPHPERQDLVCVDYMLPGGTPGGIVADAMQQIWFAPDGPEP